MPMEVFKDLVRFNRYKSVESFNNEFIQIFPNPSSEFITFKLNNSMTNQPDYLLNKLTK